MNLDHARSSKTQTSHSQITIDEPNPKKEDVSDYYQKYQPQNKVRIITATSLFDGHDASINIMRRLLQARGAEVIHLGHNRTAREVAQAALQEDVQAVAVSSYQGGHMEYFRYLRKLLDEKGGEKIKIFGGGGGVITIDEIKALKKEGVALIFSPEEGQNLGLQGMIGKILSQSDWSWKSLEKMNTCLESKLARSISLLENKTYSLAEAKKQFSQAASHKDCLVLGVTGTGGAGKSSLLDEVFSRFLTDFKDIRIGILCIDPSKKKTGGALLGDRLRMTSCQDERIFLRSLGSRGSGSEISLVTKELISLFKKQNFDLLVVETSGIGQGDTGVLDVSDLSIYVMTPEYGASTQLEKIDMLDFADWIVVNKFERSQGPDAVKDVKTSLRRSRFQGLPPKDGVYPVFGTIASRFNDDGVSGLYKSLVEKLQHQGFLQKGKISSYRPYAQTSSMREALIPAARNNYLSVIANTLRSYHTSRKNKVLTAQKLESLTIAKEQLDTILTSEQKKELEQKIQTLTQDLEPKLLEQVKKLKALKKEYSSGHYSYQVRQKKVTVDTLFTTLSEQHLPRISLPCFSSLAQNVDYLLKENRPGEFPFTGGVFSFRRKNEDPKRQFAGEGGPQKTNKRFHYLSKREQAKRLSVAFDSVTLYGADPDKRPDIYGKVGESGVSIAHLENMKTLFSGFDLVSPTTSVSMTINGPAPIILAMFLNTAMDQQLDLFKQTNKREAKENEKAEIIRTTLNQVRGTVQADILKEDQAQNTCIFSTEFALKLMGDIQEYFIQNQVRNYYSVSISGYHIAEAGANPITQLALTLANGFTYVEYYLARGFKIDQFASHLSFFFSNGLDAEYAVLGRVARRIWAVAMRDYYGAKERAQKLKYHIQTSGRSLHAQEISFNDIRTTLQALLALYDNCNSLHTNAYDEALTTPTEESVRRAMAIQMIINHEFGPNQCENINQGSYFLDELTDLVEGAVLSEFDSISKRGGVLGAMEMQYQRSKIQEESLHYEHLKHTGQIPIMGVNTFLSDQEDENSSKRAETTLARASYKEKDGQLSSLLNFQKEQTTTKEQALVRLEQTVQKNENIFAELMQTVRHCSLGEITDKLFKVGGQYRRCM